jgi:hypothetical protein
MGFLKELQASMMRVDHAAPSAADRWKPIHGVDLDRYAWLFAQLDSGGFLTAAEAQQWLASQGVAAGTWAEIHDGWTERITHSFEVSARYTAVASQHRLVRC